MMKVPISAGGGLIILAVIGAWGVVLLRSNSRPSLLPVLAGCYQGPIALARRNVMLSKSGEMLSGNVKVVVSINLDKQGISFLPASKIVMNLTGNSGIEKRSGYPLLLRIADDHLSFSIPDENGPSVRFDRISCNSGDTQ
jgi:hypothetical protein